MQEELSGREARFAILVAGVTGLAAFALCGLLGFPSVNPACWDDLAASAGLRPPVQAPGGLIRGLYSLFFHFLSPDTALLSVRVAGWVASGLLAVLASLILIGFCGDWPRVLCGVPRGRLVLGASVVSVALAFVFSDVVWYAVQGLGADGLQLVLALAGTWLLQLFVKGHRRRYAVLSMVCWSVLAADTFAGLPGVVVTAVVTYAVNRGVSLGAPDDQLGNPLVRMAFRRAMTAAFFGCFLLTVVAEVWWLRTLGGFAEIEAASPAFPDVLAYCRDWVTFLPRVASWRTWVLATVIVAGPLVVVRILRDRAIDDEDFVPVSVIVAHAILGALAWTQLCGAKTLRFTNWFSDCSLASPFLEAVLLLASGLTLVWTMLVLGAAVFLKNPRTIAVFRYADAVETPEGGRTLSALEKFARRSVPLVASIPLLIVASTLPFRWEGTLRGMLAVVEDSLVQTVDECAGATRIFTDGKLDAGLELAAFRRGRRLYAVSALASNEARELALRNRGVTREEDLKASAHNALNLLRTWANDSPEKLADAALQLAFELWRGKKEQPAYLGTVALPPTAPLRFDAAACAARAREMGERIVSLYEAGAPDRVGTSLMRTFFRDVQWRLSRLAAMRAEAAGREKWGETSVQEQKLADRLRDLNSAYRAIDGALGRVSERNGMILTPREGLKFGLEHADFKLAAIYAASVILSDPENPEANFAIGMDHFLSGSYSRAEPYLRRCLAHRPDDPAVLNNLAVVNLRLQKLDEAERLAREALGRMPKSVQIQRTLEAIRKARAEKEGTSR